MATQPNHGRDIEADGLVVANPWGGIVVFNPWSLTPEGRRVAEARGLTSGSVR